MIVAISLREGKIPAHFADTTEFMLYQINKGALEKERLRAVGAQPGSELIRVLMDDGVDVLVAGGMGRDATQRVLDAGIMLYPNCAGTAEEALGQLQQHRLKQMEETPAE